MIRRKLTRSPIGVWGAFAISFLVLWGCGRDRENPIDPNFPGSESLSPPTNVAALALEDPDLGLVVRVTWSAPTGITEYRVQRQTVGSTSSATFETVVSSQNETSFNDTNVERGKTYIYRVLSKSGSAFSEASDSVVVAVPTL